MSHFVTLVDFYMPEVEENLEETAHYKAQIAEAKEALAQSQGGNSFALRLIVHLVIGRTSLLRHLYGDRTCVQHVRCRAALDFRQTCYLSHIVHLVCHHDVITISGNVIFFYPFIGDYGC